MRPSAKIQSKNNVEDISQHVTGPKLVEREGGREEESKGGGGRKKGESSVISDSRRTFW